LGGVFCFFILPQWQVTEAQPKHYFQKLWDGCDFDLELGELDLGLFRVLAFWTSSFSSMLHSFSSSGVSTYFPFLKRS
jgi:primase-polymerase (primpol)-like protein